MSKKVDDFVTSSLRTQIRARLALCTEKQQALFPRIFPTGIDKLGEEKLRDALALVERTLAAAKKDGGSL